MAARFTGVIYVMGVSGCGKSTVANLIAEQLDIPFCEADKLHPADNINKMHQGIPLTDGDRKPWLEQVTNEARSLAKEYGACVVACSCLKQAYRDKLSEAHDSIFYVYLHGDYETIYARMSQRTGHFMPDSLLKSQYDALEIPKNGQQLITIEVDQSPGDIAKSAVAQLRERLG